MCATHPKPDLWWPIGASDEAQTQATEAKAECRACPVLDACREWALTQPEGYGVWGGMTAVERAAHLKRTVRPDPDFPTSKGQRAERQAPRLAVA
ncbi:WhiB family transcriptional regulator [Streptomyces sp. N2-109]|uniref:Transcriptional regulator WhiB n=1 Tax=Streptomyces gossypii TaxID=2883101 RepID=A0ABT2JTL1_9ACTN|nr:WhiB family transcriptional regulator [Streptomyces gossypii]